jgi:hypothetical protein
MFFKIKIVLEKLKMMVFCIRKMKQIFPILELQSHLPCFITTVPFPQENRMASFHGVTSYEV